MLQWCEVYNKALVLGDVAAMHAADVALVEAQAAAVVVSVKKFVGKEGHKALTALDPTAAGYEDDVAAIEAPARKRKSDSGE